MEGCKECIETHCCIKCGHFGGGLEFIPGQISVSCLVRPKEKVSLQVGSYPKINGEITEQCELWAPRSNTN